MVRCALISTNPAGIADLDSDKQHDVDQANRDMDMIDCITEQTLLCWPLLSSRNNVLETVGVAHTFIGNSCHPLALSVPPSGSDAFVGLLRQKSPQGREKAAQLNAPMRRRRMG